MDDGSMDVDADSPDAGIAPMGSLHRAYPPMGLFSPGQYGNLVIDPAQGYDATALLGTLPYSLDRRNVSPIISPCRTPTIMGSAGSSPDMDSRQDAQSTEDPHYMHYNQLSSSPEEDALHVSQHVSTRPIVLLFTLSRRNTAMLLPENMFMIVYINRLATLNWPRFFPSQIFFPIKCRTVHTASNRSA